jgi:peptidoglycan/LPS O-acetylase OafA/YrhL
MSTRMRYLPGLDGLRALAVVLVLLFHNGFSWMRGGFLGVSVFFTLSGYLITSLLLTERSNSGGISLGAFWSRRFRRLLPASLLAMVLVIAFSLLAADPTQRAEVGGDMIASLAYVANWWFLATEQTYAALFTSPSPLLHFWSLAIEEQFYLVLPLAAWLAFGRRSSSNGATSHGTRLFGIGLAVTLAATVAIPFVFNPSDDWLYYATPARLPELLTGVALALVLPRFRKRLVSYDAVVVPTVVGAAALAAIVWLSATSGTGSPWLYRGGFAAFSLVTVALVVTIHNPAALTTRLLGLPPLRHLGLISYGVYLYHWPLFLWINQQRTGLDGWSLFAVRMVVVLALAELSYRLIESPIRRTGRLALPSLPSPARLAPGIIAVIVVAGLLTSATAPPPAFDLAADERELLDMESRMGSPGAVDPSVGSTDPAVIEASLPVEPPPARMAVFGDSTAMSTGLGIGSWIDDTSAAIGSIGAALIGCGIAQAGQRQIGDGTITDLPDKCRAWPDYWRQRARAAAPNVALVQIGPWDVMNWRTDPNDPFAGPGDPTFDARITDDMLTAIDLLNDEGAFVVWVNAPPPNANLDQATHWAGSENVDPARFVRLNEIIATLPRLRPGKVATVDLASWYAERPDQDVALRPDGVHPGSKADAAVSASFIGESALAAFSNAWTSGTARTITAQALARWNTWPELPQLQPDEPLRVLLWSDARTPEVAAAVSAWQANSPTPMTIEVVAPSDCGISRLIRRRDENGTVTPSQQCLDRTEVNEALDRFDPHLVLVAPGDWESAEQQMYADFATMVDPTDGFAGFHTQHEYGTVFDELRQRGALVSVVLMGGTPAHRTSSNDLAAWVTRVDQLARTVALAPSRRPWLSVVELRPGADAPNAIGTAIEAAARTLTPADRTPNPENPE